MPFRDDSFPSIAHHMIVLQSCEYFANAVKLVVVC